MDKQKKKEIIVEACTKAVELLEPQEIDCTPSEKPSMLALISMYWNKYSDLERKVSVSFDKTTNKLSIFKRIR